MRLNPAAFDAFLGGNIGQRFIWRKASACPCINPNSGAPKAGCPHCFGKGFIYAKPIPATAGVANQQTQLQWAKMGLWETGDAVISIPQSSPMYDMGQRDRVTMLNSTDPFSVPLVHGAVNERLLTPVETLTRVFWYDAQGNVVEGGLPAVGDKGLLTWATGEPPPGATYTIEGTRFSEYYCFGPYASDRGEHMGARLPKRVVLRKYDIAGDRSGPV